MYELRKLVKNSEEFKKEVEEVKDLGIIPFSQREDNVDYDLYYRQVDAEDWYPFITVVDKDSTPNDLIILDEPVVDEITAEDFVNDPEVGEYDEEYIDFIVENEDIIREMFAKGDVDEN